MRLFINGLEARLTPGTSVNFNFRFLDTQEPSAIKTGFSKTITLPGCRENSEIFGDFKIKYPFQLLADDGRTLEKGYLTLDNITETNQVKSYQVTLYSTLGDFFYNLQGETDNPKTLADLYWGHVTGLTPAQESLQNLVTWNINYAYESWRNPYGLSSAFRAVPCIWDDPVMDKRKNIVYAYHDTLFPMTSSDGSGSAWESGDGSTAVLVTTEEESTCYAKQDFRVDRMPLGIRYQDIIKACCASESNGGYTVTLDSSFFNEDNPYWTNLFLLKKLPGMDYDYSVEKAEISNFETTVVRVGNYEGGSGTATKRSPISLNASSVPWVKDGDNLRLDSNYSLSDNKLEFSLTPYVYLSGRIDTKHPDYVTCERPLTVEIQVTNLDTLSTREVSKVIPANTQIPVLRMGTSEYVNYLVLFTQGPWEDSIEIPKTWRNIKIELVATNPLPSGLLNSGFLVHHTDGTTDRISGDWCFPAKPTPTWGQDFQEPFVKLTSVYESQNAAFEDQVYTKKDLLGSSRTPFEYLTTFTKMFNLRFYVKPGSKEVEILTVPRFLSKLGPLDISDRICYDRDYVKTRKVLEEEFLEFDMEPNSNMSTDNYVSEVDKNLFDRRVQVSTMKDLGGTKTYFKSNLKVGSKGRNIGSFSRRTKAHYSYYGFNQSTPYEVTFVESGSIQGENFVSEDLNLNYERGSQQYDFLTLQDGIDDTIVMYSGLRETPWNTPANITRTSVEMVQFAGKPCWLQGLPVIGEGYGDQVLEAPYKNTYYIPHYGLVPSTVSFSNGLTYANINYESLIVTSNIYDNYFADFLDRIYSNPLQVECWVRLATPELRRLYWFDNAYWILTEVSDYNYESDSPCKCKFVRYKYNA